MKQNAIFAVFVVKTSKNFCRMLHFKFAATSKLNIYQKIRNCLISTEINDFFAFFPSPLFSANKQRSISLY